MTESGWAYTSSEYSIKKTGGDLKRKSKLEPYAYWQVDRKMVSWRPEDQAAAMKGMSSVEWPLHIIFSARRLVLAHKLLAERIVGVRDQPGWLPIPSQPANLLSIQISASLGERHWEAFYCSGFIERSSSRLISDQSSNPTSSTNPNPKGRNRRRCKQRIENSNLEEQSHPIVTMTDNRTIAEMLRAPTEGYAKAIVVPPIVAEQFELKHSLINMMTTNQFFGLEKDNPHDHIRWGSPPVAKKEPSRSSHTWEDLVSKFINEFFLPSRTTNLRNKISNFQQWFDESFLEAWDRYKDLLRACPHHSFTELHQLDTFYNALNPADQDSLNVAAGGNLLERSTQDVLTIIENKSKVRNSRSKPIASQVKACDVNSNSSEIAKLTHAVNQQMNVATIAITAILKQFQGTPPPAPVKAVEETCVTCRGFAQPNVQNNQNQFGPPHGFNRGNEQACQAPASQNQNVHLNELEKVRRMNEANMKAMQTQIDMVKNELRNEIKSSIQTSLSNQTNEIKNMMASLLQINTASTSWPGSFPRNIVANPKGELKAITTRSGLVIDGPTKMLKALLSNKEKLEELANTPLNEKLSGTSINLMPLSVWKKLGLSELIPTRMTLELANRVICTPAGIEKDVFILVGKFTFPANFIIVDYESDPRMILRDDVERLTLNMRHDTSSYSNQPQKELIILINVFNISSEDFLEDLFPNQPSDNPTFLPHLELTSPEVNNDIFDSEGCNMFTDEHALDYSSPPIFDVYDDDFLEVESDAGNVYPFNSKGEKIKESKLLIDELDLPCDFHPPPEYDSFIS
nr:hypothetical protein [Tanacetum cinerariifolium]